MINLEKNFKYLKYKYNYLDLQNYKKFSYFIIGITTLFFTILFYYFYNNIFYTFSCFCILLILGYFAINYFPILVKKNILGKIEKELPFFLIDLDMNLSIGEEFLNALKKASNEYIYLKEIFSKIISNYEKGISFQKSFREFSEFFDSRDFKRALTQIINIYESGKQFKEKGPLFELSEDIINLQTTSTKLYSNKLVMISLLFIGFTAVLPALFLVFVNIGSFILDLGITAEQLLLIFILVFPSIDILIIVIILNIMPGFLK